MLERLVADARSLDWVLQFWPVLCTSLLGSFLGTMAFRRVALGLHIVDKPDSLVKTHKAPVAYLGGLGMLTGLVAGVLVGIRCLDGAQASLDAPRWLMGIVAGAIIAALVGLIDDLGDLSPATKVLGQIAAAVTLIAVGIGPDFAQMLAPPDWPLWEAVAVPLNFLVVVILVLGATNSLNLLDGLDGLCAGVTAIITFGMLLLTIHVATWARMDTGDPVRMILCLTLIGATLGFLPFNRHPARIFMGDSGSLLLGFVIAALILLFAQRPGPWSLAAIVLFGLPVLDTAVTLTRRWLNHRPLFRSDRGHLYDQMMDRGMSLRRAVDCCYLLTGLYVLLGWTVSQLRPRYAWIVSVAIVLVSAIIVTQKGFLRMKGHRGAVQEPANAERLTEATLEKGSERSPEGCG